jgi:hypothetical protein
LTPPFRIYLVCTPNTKQTGQPALFRQMMMP